MKFRLLFERSLEPIIIFDGEKVVDCNDAALSIMETTERRELVGSSIEEISPTIQPDGKLSIEKARDITRDVLRNGGSKFEWVHKNFKGKLFWVEVFLTHISIDNRILIYGTWRDITERKIVQETLRLSEKRYQEMFEMNPQPSIVFDLDTFDIVDVNQAAIDSYGFTYEEFVSMKLQQLHAPDDIPKLLEYLAVQPRGNEKGILKHVRKNGELRDVEMTGHELVFPGRGIRVEIINDVTEAKKAEEELRSSYEALKMLSAHILEVRENERKGIARELHDVLGQILTTVNMDLSWLNKRIPPEEKGLLKKVSSMISMVKQAVRTVQKVSSELRPAILDDFGLMAAIEHGAQSFEKKTGITTNIRLDRGIDIDKQRSTALFMIFQETMTNVMRHAGATKFEVSLHKDNDDIILLMEDNGHGISAGELSGKNSFGILGMRERASFIGGRLEVSGSKGKGTQVMVVLPDANTKVCQ